MSVGATVFPPLITLLSMTTQLIREDGWPQARARAELARRLSVVRWFELPPAPQTRVERLATALAQHARTTLGQPEPASARVLSGEQGRKLIHANPDLLQRMAWQKALAQNLERARKTFISSGRGRGHMLFETSGEAVLLRTGILPLDQERLREALAGTAPESLSPPLAQTLLDRLLWELGALMLWECVGDLLGSNPFKPLLSLYEEGYYPLDLFAKAPLVWAPGG